MPIAHAILPRGVAQYSPQREENRAYGGAEALVDSLQRLTKPTGLMEHHRECGQSLGPLTIPFFLQGCNGWSDSVG